MEPDEKLLNELVERIVAAVHPLRIILFGSAARGQMGPNSDFDVLIIMPDGIHRRKTAQYIYRQLIGFGFATDILVATQTDIKKYAHNPAMVYEQAFAEGKEVYHVRT